MNRKINLAIAAAVLTATGCSPDIEPNVTLPTEKTPMSFSADLAATKTSLTSTNAVVWSAGDAISVFGTSDTDNNLFSLASGTGSSNAVFEGMMTAGSTSYWAVYPYSASNSFDAATQTLTLRLPQNQSYAAGSFSTATNPMAAVGTGTSLAFKNLCGLLQFELTGNATISRIIVYDSSGMPLAGTAEVTFSDGIPTVTMTETNSLPVVIDCGTSGITLTETATTFFAVVPPRSFTAGFQIVVIDDTDNAMVTTAAATSVSRAGIRKMSPITYSLEEITYYGSANCHQFTATGDTQVHNIDTTPYITSESALYTNATAASVYGTSLAYDAETAALIWQDNASLVSDVAFANNLITFTTGASQTGNALIGLYDSSGAVVWSYHIWVTATDIENDLYTNGFTLMDRNLGALAVNNASQLFYQWGRKEPFRTTGHTTAAGPRTVAYAIANPTVFITSNGIGSWYTDDYISLWGNPFGYTALPENTYSGMKTIYDPCPEGYQVAAPAVYSDFSGSNFVWAGNGGTSSLTSGGAWYAASGFLTSTGGTVSSNGSSGFYWTNAPFDYYDYTGSLNYVGSCGLMFSATQTTAADWIPAAAAATVRCMVKP